MLDKLSEEFTRIIEQEGLDGLAIAQLDKVYLPLARWIAEKHQNKPCVIGINGAQGSGKSTLSIIIRSLLQHGFGKSSVILSIDDLYLPSNKRQELARNVHGLFAVRGVPGTHDVDLGINMLSQLKSGNKQGELLLPVFDKSQDDLLPVSCWHPVNGEVDFILFEGWCVGALPQDDLELENNINELEKYEDSEGTWRRYVNEQLKGPYSRLFSYIDYLIMLQVPDMGSVFEWRKLQERKLEDYCRKTGRDISRIMSEQQVEKFIMYYERITRHILEEMPTRADALLKLDKQHQVKDLRMGK